jgi:hypothetical protein
MAIESVPMPEQSEPYVIMFNLKGLDVADVDDSVAGAALSCAVMLPIACGTDLGDESALEKDLRLDEAAVNDSVAGAALCFFVVLPFVRCPELGVALEGDPRLDEAEAND